MVLSIVLLVFFALVLKLALAALAIYCLFPTDRACPACDAETVQLLIPTGLRRMARLLRIQSRWCMHCGERVIARGREGARVWVGPVRDVEVERLGG